MAEPDFETYRDSQNRLAVSDSLHDFWAYRTLLGVEGDDGALEELRDLIIETLDDDVDDTNWINELRPSTIEENIKNHFGLTSMDLSNAAAAAAQGEAAETQAEGPNLLRNYTVVPISDPGLQNSLENIIKDTLRLDQVFFFVDFYKTKFKNQYTAIGTNRDGTNINKYWVASASILADPAPKSKPGGFIRNHEYLYDKEVNSYSSPRNALSIYGDEDAWSKTPARFKTMLGNYSITQKTVCIDNKLASETKIYGPNNNLLITIDKKSSEIRSSCASYIKRMPLKVLEYIRGGASGTPTMAVLASELKIISKRLGDWHQFMDSMSSHSLISGIESDPSMCGANGLIQESRPIVQTDPMKSCFVTHDGPCLAAALNTGVNMVYYCTQTENDYFIYNKILDTPERKYENRIAAITSIERKLSSYTGVNSDSIGSFYGLIYRISIYGSSLTQDKYNTLIKCIGVAIMLINIKGVLDKRINELFTNISDTGMLARQAQTELQRATEALTPELQRATEALQPELRVETEALQRATEALQTAKEALTPELRVETEALQRELQRADATRQVAAVATRVVTIAAQTAYAAAQTTRPPY